MGYELITAIIVVSLILIPNLERIKVMASKIKLSKQELSRLEKDFKDCQAIREDFERAMKAGVPNLEVIQERLNYLEARIDSLISILGEK